MRAFIRKPKTSELIPAIIILTTITFLLQPLLQPPLKTLSTGELSDGGRRRSGSWEDYLRRLRLRANRVFFLCQKDAANHPKTNGRVEDASYSENAQDFIQKLVIIPENRLIWCPVPKVASTSIGRAIVDVKNLTVKMTGKELRMPQVYLWKRFKRQRSPELQLPLAFTSFFVTRHPFTRIVSAYLNKLQNASVHDGSYFYELYGKKIVRRYRRHRSGEQNPNKEPSFQEFVQYLLHTPVKNYDEHWKPVTQLCSVCLYRYDFVLKLEHFEKEFESLRTFFIKKKIFPPNFKIDWKNKVDSAKMDSILKTLPEKAINGLYRKYKDDFIFFDYDYKPV